MILQVAFVTEIPMAEGIDRIYQQKEQLLVMVHVAGTWSLKDVVPSSWDVNIIQVTHSVKSCFSVRKFSAVDAWKKF